MKLIENPLRYHHVTMPNVNIFSHHRNILELVEYFEEEDKFYLVFEKLRGGKLCDCQVVWVLFFVFVK